MNQEKYWDRMARFYDGMFSNNKSYKVIYESIKELLNKDMNVLEIGTGTGLIAREVAPFVNSVKAIDISPEMINKANILTKLKNIDFMIGNGKNLKFDKDQFDLVIISNVLHVVDQPENILSEILRVLKIEGIMVAITYMWKELSLLGRIQKFVMIKKGFPIISCWNKNEYLDFLQKNGFIIKQSKSIKSSFNICLAECKICLK